MLWHGSEIKQGVTTSCGEGQVVFFCFFFFDDDIIFLLLVNGAC